MTNVIKAIKAPVFIGNIEIEGLAIVAEDMTNPEYRLSQSQALTVVGEDKGLLSQWARRDSKPLKALQAIGFRGYQKELTIVNDAKARKAKSLSLEDVAILWAYLNSCGNVKATALVVASTQETLERRFNRAFGVKVSEDEYNDKMALRLQRLMARHQWGDVIKAKMTELGYYDTDKERAWAEFRELTMKVNYALFNTPHFKSDRDNMTEKQQQLITAFERCLVHNADKHPELDHFQLVDRVLQVF